MVINVVVVSYIVMNSVVYIRNVNRTYIMQQFVHAHNKVVWLKYIIKPSYKKLFRIYPVI